MKGAFFELLSVGSERFARCLCAPGRLAFLQERSERLKWKKSNSEQKTLTFFSIVQSNERRGGPSVVVTKVYRCLESPETVMMEDKLFVSVAGYPELYFLRFLLI